MSASPSCPPPLRELRIEWAREHLAQCIERARAGDLPGARFWGGIACRDLRLALTGELVVPGGARPP